jgi:iron-sulfur cluster repair protein YtfE (RIC family)
MDAIEFLKKEHQNAKAEFGKVEQAAPAERGKAWKALKPELELHEQIEEACLYGPLAQDGEKSSWAEWRKHHQEEVHKIEATIKEIEALDAKDDTWLAKVKEVKSSLEHHIREEEDDVFPKVSREWDRTRLERAGAQMEEMHASKARRAA